MINLDLTVDETDDPRFVSLAAQIITGAVVTHKSLDVHIFKIDHWFDHKWLGFSGKFLGAVGSWRKKLTVPPFVANRIIDKWHYSIDAIDGTYRLETSNLQVHHCGRAGENLHRRVQQVAPASALFWYSGDTSETGRGSLMGYIPVESDHWPWFVALVLDKEWQVVRRKGIHEYEVRMFRQAGAQSHSELLRNDVVSDA
jgi:hypothetical protein